MRVILAAVIDFGGGLGLHRELKVRFLRGWRKRVLRGRRGWSGENVLVVCEARGSKERIAVGLWLAGWLACWRLEETSSFFVVVCRAAGRKLINCMRLAMIGR
jgi:hypothetical protein